MIFNTFCILDGIGEKRERRLWREGILTWKDFLDADTVLSFGPEQKRLFDESLFCFQEALSAGDAGFFREHVRIRDHWRLYELFHGDVVCLDIETNGLHPGGGGHVTMVGLYDGHDYRCLVHGKNLSAETLADALRGYKCLITFYGAAFDIPFLSRSLGMKTPAMPHFDLCFAARRLKLQGGLKRLEHALGIEREDAVKGMNGYDAVRLWELWRRGDQDALDLLVRYNREDTVNLMRIAPVLYEQLRQSTGLEEYLACAVA